MPEKSNLSNKHRLAIISLIEGFEFDDLQTQDIVDFLIDSAKYGLSGVEDGTRKKYNLIGFNTFKRFSYKLTDVAANFRKEYDEENSWVPIEELMQQLKKSRRHIEGFKEKHNALITDKHIRKDGRVYEYHLRNFIKLYKEVNKLR